MNHTLGFGCGEGGGLGGSGGRWDSMMFGCRCIYKKTCVVFGMGVAVGWDRLSPESRPELAAILAG